MMIRRVCVTGGAGFIGSHIVRRLLQANIRTVVLDSFLTGRPEFLPARHELLTVIDGSIHDHDALVRAIDGCDWVIHMAAHAEGRRGFARPGWDLRQNTLGTALTLEAMRAVGATRIFYASSGSVYGDTALPTIPEDCPFPTQTSLYGASKIAGEGLVGAYVAAGELDQGIIGRWMQAIGPHYLHGHVIDFVRQLRRHPDHLKILGDGTQAKSGIHVDDLAHAITWLIREPLGDGLHVYNIGSDEMLTIAESAHIIAETMGCDPEIRYEGSTWAGDNPHTYLDTTRLRARGWVPIHKVEDAIRETVTYLCAEARYL